MYYIVGEWTCGQLISAGVWSRRRLFDLVYEIALDTFFTMRNDQDRRPSHTKNAFFFSLSSTRSYNVWMECDTESDEGDELDKRSRRNVRELKRQYFSLAATSISAFVHLSHSLYRLVVLLFLCFYFASFRLKSNWIFLFAAYSACHCHPSSSDDDGDYIFFAMSTSVPYSLTYFNTPYCSIIVIAVIIVIIIVTLTFRSDCFSNAILSTNISWRIRGRQKKKKKE